MNKSKESQQKTIVLSLISTQPINKAYHGHRTIIYEHLIPIQKDTHNGGLDCLFFFFFIDKKDVYIEKRKHQKQCPQSIQGVYKRSQKAQTKGEGIETKNITCP